MLYSYKVILFCIKVKFNRPENYKCEPPKYSDTGIRRQVNAGNPNVLVGMVFVRAVSNLAVSVSNGRNLPAPDVGNPG